MKKPNWQFLPALIISIFVTIAFPPKPQFKVLGINIVTFSFSLILLGLIVYPLCKKKKNAIKKEN